MAGRLVQVFALAELACVSNHIIYNLMLVLQLRYSS